MDINFFSWNVKNNKDATFYQELTAELKKRKIEVLILQEFFEKNTSLLPDFDEIKDFADQDGSNTLRIFINKTSKIIDDKATSYNNNKQRCVTLKASDGFIFNLVGVHMYSMAGKSELRQIEENIDVGRNIREFNVLTSIDRTIIVGDLNYQPFSPAIQSPITFNAINGKQIVRKHIHRNVAQVKYDYYYNPMWNLMGDYDYVTKKEKVAGTYYLDTEDSGLYHWSVLDGVLLSKTIMDNLDMHSLEIVVELNGKNLLHSTRAGTKKKSYIDEKYSDHLPITFTIKTN